MDKLDPKSWWFIIAVLVLSFPTKWEVFVHPKGGYFNDHPKLSIPFVTLRSCLDLAPKPASGNGSVSVAIIMKVLDTMVELAFNESYRASSEVI